MLHEKRSSLIIKQRVTFHDLLHRSRLRWLLLVGVDLMYRHLRRIHSRRDRVRRVRLSDLSIRWNMIILVRFLDRGHDIRHNDHPSSQLFATLYATRSSLLLLHPRVVSALHSHLPIHREATQPKSDVYVKHSHPSYPTNLFSSSENG